MCVSICLHSAGCPGGSTDLKFSPHIRDDRILENIKVQCHGRKVKVSKVKIYEIPVFGLVWEIVVTRVNVKVNRVKLKLVGGIFTPSTRGRYNKQAFVF